MLQPRMQKAYNVCQGQPKDTKKKIKFTDPKYLENLLEKFINSCVINFHSQYLKSDKSTKKNSWLIEVIENDHEQYSILIW